MLIGNTRIGGIGSLSVKNTYDPDALAYLTAVEAADGQALENSVKIAINTFVVGCKADGIWDAIVASCILCGARTLNGALTPLKGNAPTGYNFTGLYDRKLGLAGDNATAYIATGYSNNDTTNFPQNDTHISCWVDNASSDSSGVYIGTQNTIGNILSIYNTSSTNILFRNRAGTGRTLSLAPYGFQGSTRNNSANFVSRATSSSGGVSETTTTATSGGPLNSLIGVFAGFSGATPGQFSSPVISFYSIGKSLTLSLLDARVTTLKTTIDALL